MLLVLLLLPLLLRLLLPLLHRLDTTIVLLLNVLYVITRVPHARCPLLLLMLLGGCNRAMSEPATQ